MSYVALYRKARPRTFDEVQGQEHVTRTLRNQVRTGRLQHAYLFCGTRGTGKTSVAKILARAVNCTDPRDGNPCGECEDCRGIADGTLLNVIEIDAASNNGVDNIRDIIEEVQYRPTRGAYKVYIIDEVHMLSTGAFNALLKTLEEPPSYVIFILCTTEAGRIPVTILSRCQRYDFRRIDSGTIASHMKKLAEDEGIETEDRALRFIARTADGSMRDALSLLDRCMAVYMDKPLTYERVLAALGEADTDIFRKMTLSACAGDAGEVLRIFSAQMAAGAEVSQFIRDYIWYLRNLLVVRVSTPEEAEETIDMSEAQFRELMETAGEIDTDTVMRYIRVLSELQNRMRYAANRRIPAEIALITLAKPEGDRSEDALLGRIRELETRLDGMQALERKLDEILSGGYAVTKEVPAAAQPENVPEEKKVPLPDAAPEDLKQVVGQWSELIASLPAGLLKQQLRENAHLKFDAETLDARLYVELGGGEAARNIAEHDNYREDLEQYLSKKTGRHIPVEFHQGRGVVPGLALVDLETAVRQRIHMPVEITDEDDEEDDYF